MRVALMFVMALCAADAAYALNPARLPSQYVQERHASESGLPSDTVWTVRQDGRGYLWIGAQSGLVRFDGVRFTTYTSQTHPGLRSNDVRALAFAPDGALWIGTYGSGVAILVNGEFTGIDSTQGLANDVVYDIHVAANGDVWFATGGGASRLRNGELRNFTTADGLADNRLFRIAEDVDGTIWFGTLTNGLSRFDGERFVSFATAEGLDSSQVHLLFRDDALGLIAGTSAGGVYHLSEAGLEVTDLALPESLVPHAALRDSAGTLWIGSYGGGLWRQVPGGQFEQFRLDAPQQAYIFDLLEDREGNVWVASMHGLQRISDTPFVAFGSPEGLANSTFVVTQSQADEAIWVGTEGDGLLRLDVDGSVRQYTTDHGLSNNSVSALHVDADNTVWAGTFGGGVNRLHDGGFSYLTRADGLADDHVMGIIRHSNGTLWIAGDGGVARYDEQVVTPVAGNDALPDTLIRQLMEDSFGRLWLASNSGLISVDADTITVWNRELGLASNMVGTTYEDADGVLWIGTRDGGLARLEGNSLFQFTSDQGLPQLSVHGILEDHRGVFWLSGAGGLVAVARADLNRVAHGAADRFEARLYREADGLRSVQFRGGFQPSAWRGRDGRLWFPTSLGLVALAPDDIRPSPPVEPIIEEVRVDGERVAVAGRLMLPSGARSLEIDYTAPQLRNPDTLRFHYRMEGADRDWHRADARRTAYFTGLRAGEKTFRVAVSTPEQAGLPVNALPQALLVIYRQPFWYQAWWFRLLALTAGIALIIGGYRLTLRQLTLRQRRLEALVDQRTDELQRALAKVEEISRIDGLTGVANRRHFDEALITSWSQAVRQQAPLSVVMVDIDFFKQFNDSVGHLAGDECLRRIAASLNVGMLRDGDLIARYGGEEFIALLPRTGAKAAAVIAERIQQTVADLQIPHPGSEIAPVVTVSLGCATAWPQRGDPPDGVLARADSALYMAKAKGRNQICLAD